MAKRKQIKSGNLDIYSCYFFTEEFLRQTCSLQFLQTSSNDKGKSVIYIKITQTKACLSGEKNYKESDLYFEHMYPK